MNSEAFRVIQSIQGSIGEVEKTIYSQVFFFPKMRLKKDVLIRSDHLTYIAPVEVHLSSFFSVLLISGVGR